MNGYGFNTVFKNVNSGPSVDADAQAYYDALNTANGGQVDYNALYSISNEAALTAFSNHFTTLKSAGVYSKLVHYYPFFGGTANTHAVCAVDFTGEITFSGSPTHDADGVGLSGTQYIDTNVVPFDDLSRDDVHMMQLTANTSDTSFGFGNASNSSTYQFWAFQNATTKITRNCTTAGAISAASAASNVVYISNRDAINSLDIYSDGSSVGSDSTNNALQLPTNNVYFGARNLNGTADVHLTGDVQSASLGQGFTSTEAGDFTTAIKNLQTTFGR